MTTDYSKLSDFGNPLTLQEGLITEHKRTKSSEKKRLLERAIAYIREHEGLNKEV
jgi:hypothetical protein